MYEIAKSACVLLQVDMKTIEIAYWSQWNVGMSYNTSCHENRRHALTAVFYQMVKYTYHVKEFLEPFFLVDVISFVIYDLKNKWTMTMWNVINSLRRKSTKGFSQNS